MVLMNIQRYNRGCRQVVGCIPYRFIKTTHPSLIDVTTLIQELEVLVISSQKSQRLMFPKGGWEIDESMGSVARDARRSRRSWQCSNVVLNNLGNRGRSACFCFQCFHLLILCIVVSSFGASCEQRFCSYLIRLS
ncbi:hypothetical protein L1049_006103 [Liquidambar formosana]|uniref:Uncharacterized protein n=1 Tax=Liquidambar formosana TaxID=63359 RepID=A0AAP0RGT3_LIQFO